MNTLTLAQAQERAEIIIRRLFKEGFTAEQIQEHPDLTALLDEAGDSTEIHDADSLEDFITEQLGLHL